MNIHVLCPNEENKPFGGVRKLYRHVDILRRHGFNAWILHQTPGFRCTWFQNETPVVAMSELGSHPLPDILVIPETCGKDLQQLPGRLSKVIFNQNCYYTFHGYTLDQADLTSPYLAPDVIATLVVSDDSRNYLQHVFPNQRIHRIHNAVDGSLFRFQERKKPRIAFMPRKREDELLQVINLLKFRGALADYELAPISDRTEAEVAAILRESLLFLSCGHPEGFSLPPAEAMACGCIVVGYHGMGGREYFREDFCYPVAVGDIRGFVERVETVLELHKTNAGILAGMARRASDFIRREYSPKREEEDILGFWRGFGDNPSHLSV